MQSTSPRSLESYADAPCHEIAAWEYITSEVFPLLKDIPGDEATQSPLLVEFKEMPIRRRLEQLRDGRPLLTLSLSTYHNLLGLLVHVTACDGERRGRNALQR